MATEASEQRLEFDGGALRVRVHGRGEAARQAPLVLHLHGGAFVQGSIDTAHTVPTLLAEAGAVVVSAEYPLAPAQRFPHALEILFGLLTSLHRDRVRWSGKRSRLYVAGEEAGGNLAAALALMARDQQAPALAGQILLSPMVDACMATCSIRQAEAGQVGCQWADGWHQYLGTADKAAHPYAAPLGSSRLAGLAPALVVTAQDDLLRDEAFSYARRLRESGVAVREHIVPAPSHWPCALNDPASVAAPWSAALRRAFTDFFFASGPVAARISAAHSIASQEAS